MPSASAGLATASPPEGEPVRVMVVDDSAVIRGMLSRWLESEPGISVVNTSGNGLIALNALPKYHPEVIILDIEMPVMDGMTALPKLLEADPDIKVVMASTLTLRNADISLRALSSGAADYIPKPTSTRDILAADHFKRDLIEKVKALGEVRRRKVRPARRAKTSAPAAAAGKRPAIYRDTPVVLRNSAMLVPNVLAIGSSTGGPQALFKLFESLGNKVQLPIFITQHMPPTFTTILAEHIARVAKMPCAEAQDGEAVQAGQIYLAPGNFHMTVKMKSGEPVISLNQDPPINFCRPAVDPMLDSLTEAFGGRILTVILTGMGQDGLMGGRHVVEKGGAVIAQDEATSVVWGMPGAVATNGVCCAVLPIERIGEEVLRLIGGRRS